MAKDTPIFVIGGSCAIEKQIDICVPESQGKFTRPRIFNEAQTISVAPDGSFEITWRDGMHSRVNASNVASFAISGA